MLDSPKAVDFQKVTIFCATILAASSPSNKLMLNSKVERKAAAARGGQVGPRSLARVGPSHWHSRSKHARTCTPLHSTLLLGTRAAFGTVARNSTGPRTRWLRSSCMRVARSMPATTMLATAVRLTL